MTHKKIIVPMKNWSKEYVDGEDCDGRIGYNEVLEGNVCDKCDYYDGVK